LKNVEKDRDKFGNNNIDSQDYCSAKLSPIRYTRVGYINNVSWM